MLHAVGLCWSCTEVDMNAWRLEGYQRIAMVEVVLGSRSKAEEQSAPWRERASFKVLTKDDFNGEKIKLYQQFSQFQGHSFYWIVVLRQIQENIKQLWAQLTPYKI